MSKGTDFSNRSHRENINAITNIEETINKSRQVVQKSKELLSQNSKNLYYDDSSTKTPRRDSFSALNKPYISPRRSLHSSISETELGGINYGQEIKSIDYSLENRKLKFECQALEDELLKTRSNNKILKQANESQAKLYVKKIEELENEIKRFRMQLVEKENRDQYVENVVNSMREEANQIRKEKEMLINHQEKAKNLQLEELASLNMLFQNSKSREDELRLQLQQYINNSSSTRFELEKELETATRKLHENKCEFEIQIERLRSELENEKRINLDTQNSSKELNSMETKIRELENQLYDQQKINEELRLKIRSNNNQESSQTNRIIELEDKLRYHSQRYNELKDRVQKTEATPRENHSQRYDEFKDRVEKTEVTTRDNISPFNFTTIDSARSQKELIKSPRFTSKLAKKGKKKIKTSKTCEVCKRAGVSLNLSSKLKHK